MTRKKLPLPTYLVTCDNDWEHCSVVEGSKMARAFMVDHAAGRLVEREESWVDCLSSSYRVWELYGSAKVIVEERVDLEVTPTEDSGEYLP